LQIEGATSAGHLIASPEAAGAEFSLGPLRNKTGRDDLLSCAPLVTRRLAVADVLAMPFYHPVVDEGLRSALRDLAQGVAGAGGADLSDCKAIGHDALD
jgi:hypothetical protein